MEDSGSNLAFIAGWIIGTFVFAIIGYLLGKNLKGKAIAGLWLGLILGPIGLLIIFLLTDLRPHCPRCGSVINPNYPVCPNCKSDIESSKIENIPDNSLKKKIVCQKCGNNFVASFNKGKLSNVKVNC